MKTILSLLVGLSIATSVHGASIDWTVSGKNQALSDYLGNTAANTTVYLILADTASLAKITDVSDESTFMTSLETIKVGSVVSNDAGKKPASITTTVDSPLLTASANYTLASIYLSKDADGNGFYKIAKGEGVAYDPTVDGSSGGISTDWGTMRSAAWTKGYTAAAVPEPSTAVLALAGLALLLKRRKA